MGIGPDQLDILSELESTGQLKLRLRDAQWIFENLEHLMKEGDVFEEP